MENKKPTSANKTPEFENVLGARDTYKKLESQTEIAYHRLEEAKQLFLEKHCPIKKGDTVVIAHNKTFIVEDISVDTSENFVEWQANGKRQTYDASLKNPTSETSVLIQPYLDLLSDAVKSLKPKDVIEAHKEQRDAWLQKQQTGKLKLADSQSSMLCHLWREGKFSLLGQLPRGVSWGTPSRTQKVWQALVDKGVLELVKGDKEYINWTVAPGPRLEEAAEMAKIKFNPKDIAAARKRLTHSSKTNQLKP